MVFFTSILIVAILYYMQAEGLIYVTLIAVVAELVNMFMSQTLTKSVEKKLNAKWGKMLEKYKKQLAVKTQKIEELEKIQEESVQKLYTAKKKIKLYEQASGIKASEIDKKPDASPDETDPGVEETTREFIDLPCGSDEHKKTT